VGAQEPEDLMLWDVIVAVALVAVAYFCQWYARAVDRM